MAKGWELMSRATFISARAGVVLGLTIFCANLANAQFTGSTTHSEFADAELARLIRIAESA